MQETWPVVALAAIAAVVVGAIIGVRRSGSAVQSRAIVWSLCSLALVAAFCCIAAVSGVFSSLTWLFAVLFVIVPAVVYAYVVLAASAEASTSSPVRTSSRVSAATTASRGRAMRASPLAASQAENEAEQTAARTPRFVPIEMNFEQAVDATQHARTFSSQAPEQGHPADEGELATTKNGLAVEVPDASESVGEPFGQAPLAAVYPPPLGEVKSAALNEQAAGAAPRKLEHRGAVDAPASGLAASAELEPEPALKLRPESVSAPEPGVESAPQSKPQSKSQSKPLSEPGLAPALGLSSKPKSIPLDPTSEDCFQKAAAFKARGLHVPAARLFAEAAALAESDTARRRARFEELSCYVKADQPEKARPLVEALNQSSVLTKVERIKLEAAGRLL